MATRAELKSQSQHRILQAAATRLRQEGLAGAGIADVMRDAGLTHGAFYSHFANKTELSVAALQHALLENRARWVGERKDETWAQRLHRLAGRYLTKGHRDNPAEGCALAALSTEAVRSDEVFREAFEAELLKSVQGVCNGSLTEQDVPASQRNEAIAFLALCVGGLSLSRAVPDKELSARILRACTEAAGRIASDEQPARPGKEDRSHDIS